MSDFEYVWNRKEANFGPPIEREAKGGTHFTIESILRYNGKYVALRRPHAIPHHDIPARVGKNFLYFVHDLPLWGESLEQYLQRIVREQAGVGVKSFRVVDLTMNTYEQDQQWALTPFMVVELDALPVPGVYGNEVSEVVTFNANSIPSDFGWYTPDELATLLKKCEI